MKQHIFAKDISGHHPFGMLCSTDLDYARVANAVYPIIWDSIKDVDSKSCRWMSLKIALYMEDIVAEFGVWESFVTKNRELYGKELPFYERPGQYWMNEPNLNDVRFILWSAAMEVSEKKKTIINPETPALMTAAGKVFEYLDTQFEDLPINEQLEDFVFNTAIYDKFLMQRDLLKWIFFDCYLTRGRLTEEYLDEDLEEVSAIVSNADKGQQYYGAECIACFNHKVGPLALYPKDYLAGILRTKHLEECARRVEEQQFKEYSIYKIESWNSDRVRLLSARGDIVPVKLSAYDDGIETTLAKTSHCIGSYVLYNGDWQVNGITSWGDLDRQFSLLQMRLKPDNVIGRKAFEKLIDLAKGERLIFAKDWQELREMFGKSGLGKYMPEPEARNEENFSYIALYIDSLEKGLCIVNNAAKIIKSPFNPYYDPDLGGNDYLAPLADPDSLPGELVQYLLEKDYLPDAALNSVYGAERGRELVQENKDFIARFFRQDSF